MPSTQHTASRVALAILLKHSKVIKSTMASCINIEICLNFPFQTCDYFLGSLHLSPNSTICVSCCNHIILLLGWRIFNDPMQTRYLLGSCLCVRRRDVPMSLQRTRSVLMSHIAA